MALYGPIIVIEDDPNDIEVITTAVNELGYPNAVRPFADAQAALDYLRTTEEKPFVILCDVRMPRINGLALRKAILDDNFLRKKAIPFVFFTGAVSMDIIREAYELQAQGFYAKAKSYTEVKNQLEAIIVYWKHCLHPSAAESVDK
jgi:CheY-like chemotaxis protein